jgi:indole-3-glycerol phosphate synthase
MNILENITHYMYAEVKRRSTLVPSAVLERSYMFSKPCRSITTALSSVRSSGVIAEFKRKSPSKGNINIGADPLETALGYEKSGAAAVSVLTNNRFFGGSAEFLTLIANTVSIPVLRKEFVVDSYQITEARALGADFILLIAEILTRDTIIEFTDYAHDLGMEVLLELHSEDQLDKWYSEIDVLGVNNRDLATFKVDIERSIALAERMPDSVLKIAESGLDSAQGVMYLKKNGFSGFLMGEHFMKNSRPDLACKHFIESL